MSQRFEPMPFGDALVLEKKGWPIRRYDPTLHCDNKCLRAGHCLGAGCPTNLWQVCGEQDKFLDCG